MENLKNLEIRINKIEKKILKKDSINKQKLLTKLSFLITRVEEIKKSLAKKKEIADANKNTIKSHSIKASNIHKRKPINWLAAKVTGIKK